MHISMINLNYSIGWLAFKKLSIFMASIADYWPFLPDTYQNNGETAKELFKWCLSVKVE